MPAICSVLLRLLNAPHVLNRLSVFGKIPGYEYGTGMPKNSKHQNLLNFIHE